MYTRSNRDVKFAGDAKFTSGYEDLSALALGASDQSKIDAVKKAFDEVYSRARVLVSMSNDSAFFNRKVEHIVHMLGDLERQVSRVFALHQAQLIKNTNRTTTQAQIMAVVIVLICMALAYFIARRIIVRLYDLVRRMDDIAQGEGDLTAKVEIEGRDEITRVAKSFNEFTEKMRSSFIRVFEAVDRVNQVAQELVETNRGVAQRVNVQEQSIDAVATAVEELSHTSRDVAETTESASNSAKDSDQHANQGQAVVSEAVSAINILADEISRNAEVIDNLRSQSESISAIVDVIQGIAEQTNLLALNAAIEAARAGEQGRGFAVVADEVRMLASRTHESTEEIVSMIKSIQDSAQTAASEMSSSVESARSCVVQVETAGQALDSIVHGIDHITGLNAQIASASEEQRVTTETVSRDVISIRDNAEETSEASKQAETLCLGLSEEVSQVKSVLSQFKY
jgi:methyl-accepting chemotaxis protein